MRVFLFAFFALLFFSGCESSSEDSFSLPNPKNWQFIPTKDTGFFLTLKKPFIRYDKEMGGHWLNLRQKEPRTRAWFGQQYPHKKNHYRGEVQGSIVAFWNVSRLPYKELKYDDFCGKSLKLKEWEKTVPPQKKVNLGMNGLHPLKK